MRASWTGLGLLVPALAAADPVPVAGAKASSHYTESGTYTPDRVADGKQTTAWVEGEPGSGLGSWIELDLGGEHALAGIRLWAGDWSSYDNWRAASRPKQLELRFSDGTTKTLTLRDEKVAQTFDLGGKKTSTVRLKIEAAYSGLAWSDTGISELQLLTGTDAVTARASSVHVEDGDGNYVAANAVDGVLDSMWCEGVNGDGTGQWLEVDFGAPRTIRRVVLLNGIGTSLSLWFGANQATALTLRFSDGSSADVAIPMPSFKPTAYDFPEVTTQTVRLEVTGVKKGRKYDDLCVSEVRFE